MSPKISIIIPVYNVEKYIERCARSLFNQTLNEIEYIFVNDCSQDNSIEKLKRVIALFPQRGPFIKIINHTKNKGLPAARQTGLNVATGEYIIHCDSDDWVDINLYENMYNLAKRDNLDVVVCDYMLTDGHQLNNPYSGGHATDINQCISELLHRKMWWTLCNKLIKKNIYSHKIIYPNDAMGEDMCMTLQLIAYCHQIGYIHGAYYYYYQNPKSIVLTVNQEACKRKYKELCNNVEILHHFYAHHTNPAIKKGLTYLDFYKQEVLFPLLSDDYFYNIWKTGLKDVTLPVVFNTEAQLKQRIKALLIYIGIYPFRK